MLSTVMLCSLYLGNKMIRNIIKATLLFTVVVSVSSVVQVAMALDLNLQDYSYIEPKPPYAGSSDSVWQQNSQNQGAKARHSHERNSQNQDTFGKRFSFEIYQGDGLDDLRSKSYMYHNVILPKVDAEAYGISIKQRF